MSKTNFRGLRASTMQPERQNLRQFLFSKTGLVLAGFLFVTGYFLWTEHQAHLIDALPWILVGFCLVMHFFLHRSHGNASSGNGDRSGSRDGNGGSA